MATSISNYRVAGVVEVPFSIVVQATSEPEAEDIAYDKMSDTSDSVIYIETVEYEDE